MATATLAATAVLTAGAAALAIPRVHISLAVLARRDVLAVAALAAGGLALRLLATRGIWLDEATSISQAQMPLGDMLHTLRSTDVHPPLHHVVLWVTVRALGTGELAVRVPSLIAATALVPVLYAVGKDIYDRRAGLAAAALGAVAPFAIWYAQEARMYALFMVFALLALWAQVRILRGGGTLAWVGYAAGRRGARLHAVLRDPVRRRPAARVRGRGRARRAVRRAGRSRGPARSCCCCCR